MRIESTVTVNCPIEEVWAFMADPFNIPRVGPAMLALRQTSPGPTGVGSVWEGRMVFLGSERRITAVVTEWDPPRAGAFSWRVAGMGSGSICLTLEATAEGTKVVRVVELEPRGFWKLLSPIVGPLFRRRGNADSRNIKRPLEAGRV